MLHVEDPLPSKIMYLYHATYRPYVRQIFEQGLGGARKSIPRNYEDSKSGVVYLASSPEVALSYAETSDAVPAEWLDEIVVLRVHVEHLDATFLQADRNVKLAEGEQPETFEYHAVILPAALELIG